MSVLAVQGGCDGSGLVSGVGLVRSDRWKGKVACCRYVIRDDMTCTTNNIVARIRVVRAEYEALSEVVSKV